MSSIWEETVPRCWCMQTRWKSKMCHTQRQGRYLATIAIRNRELMSTQIAREFAAATGINYSDIVVVTGRGLYVCLELNSGCKMRPVEILRISS